MTGFGYREGNPHVNPQLLVARENAPLLPDTPEVNARMEVFSLEKFVFLCLGIGHKYCEWTQLSAVKYMYEQKNLDTLNIMSALSVLLTVLITNLLLYVVIV